MNYYSIILPAEFTYEFKQYVKSLGSMKDRYSLPIARSLYKRGKKYVEFRVKLAEEEATFIALCFSDTTVKL